MLAWQLDLSGACDHNVTRPFGRRSPPIAANLLCVDYSLVANDDVGRLDDRTEIEQETKEQPLALVQHVLCTRSPRDACFEAAHAQYAAQDSFGLRYWCRGG